jgi:hypothetical protein
LHLCVVHSSTSLIFWLICAFRVQVLNFVAPVYWLYYDFFLQYVLLGRPIYKHSTGTRNLTGSGSGAKLHPRVRVWVLNSNRL